MVLSQNKYLRLPSFIRSAPHRHHFSNANTFEIVFGLVLISVITRLIDVLSREARY